MIIGLVMLAGGVLAIIISVFWMLWLIKHKEVPGAHGVKSFSPVVLARKRLDKAQHADSSETRSDPNQPMANRWQRKIIKECEKRLGRKLNQEEMRFITSRGGFIALEMIEDTVNSLEGRELEEYLSSEY